MRSAVAPPDPSRLAASAGVARRCLAEARAALDLDVAWLTRFSGDALRVWAIDGDGAAFGLAEGASVPIDRTPCASLAAGARSRVIGSERAARDAGELSYGAAQAMGAYVGVPIRLPGDRLYGSLCGAAARERPALDERDARLLAALAGVIGGLLEHDPHDEVLAAVAEARAQEEHLAVEAAEIARAQAERANQAKSEFLGRMSHELRTPLNAVLGFGQLLALDPLTDDQRDSVGHILKAGAHLLELVDEVLEISRIEAGAMRLSLAPVPVGAVIAEVVELVAPLAAERALGFRVDADPGGGEVWVRADRRRLTQILLNLLSNAIKYNRHGGMVTVRVRPLPGERVRVVVSDTGEGLRPQQIARIFSPFERLDAGEGPTPGTGLGLALSRSLAEAMDGELTAASEPGYGCDLTLVLATVPAPVPEATGDAGRGDLSPPGVPPAPRKILCIEDDPANLHLVERVLRPAGLEVIAAPQGRLGLDLARRHAPDAILLDLGLPDLPGAQVLELLAADPVTARIPVYVCSADATPAAVAHLTGLGARDYLTKPLDVGTLLKTLGETTDER